MTPLSSGANTQLVVVSEGGDGPCSLAPLIDINVKKATIYKIIPTNGRAGQPDRLSKAQDSGMLENRREDFCLCGSSFYTYFDT